VSVGDSVWHVRGASFILCAAATSRKFNPQQSTGKRGEPTAGNGSERTTKTGRQRGTRLHESQGRPPPSFWQKRASIAPSKIASSNETSGAR